MKTCTCTGMIDRLPTQIDTCRKCINWSALMQERAICHLGIQMQKYSKKQCANVINNRPTSVI